MCFNNIVRYVYKVPRREHISNYVKDFIGCTFEKYIQIRNLVLMYKIIYFESAPSYLKRRFNTSSSARLNNLVLPNHKKVIMKKSFVVRVVSQWNNLSPRTLKNFQNSPIYLKKKLMLSL